MKLHYFEFYGRAEPIRLLLSHAGVQFDDVRHKMEDWPELKQKSEQFELGQLPVLEKDGKNYCQAMAILRYLGASHGYLPEDAEQLYRVDRLMDLLSDFCVSIFKLRHVTEPEEQKTMFGELCETHYPKYFGYWEKELKSNSSQEFLVGDKASIVDFAYLAVYGSFINHGMGKEMVLSILKNFPTLQEYFEKRWEAQKDHFNNRPECPY